jgi:hypothetical protein
MTNSSSLNFHINTDDVGLVKPDRPNWIVLGSHPVEVTLFFQSRAAAEKLITLLRAAFPPLQDEAADLSLKEEGVIA